MRQIVIPFELDDSWIGGAYYIRNLISSMKLLPETEQPFIALISERSESVAFILETGYLHIGWIKHAEFEVLAKDGQVDVLFPIPLEGQEARTISWIPDFQELHLPYFFSEDEIARRRDHHRRRIATAGLIVSSEDVRKDAETLFEGESKNVAVVRFASFDTANLDRVELVRQKYKISGPYVLCANQVWLHKNHIVVIRAMSLLKAMNIDVTIVFTGSESDYRVKGYADFLKRTATEWGVDDRVRFLGFIPRQDQLCLIKGARYIVQPSLFEGWSTVIEDAKSMGKFVVASDLAVHKEQLTEASRFFFRNDPQDLADVMVQIERHEREGPLPLPKADYSEAQRRFSNDFVAAVERFLPRTDGREQVRAMARLRMFSDINMSGLSFVAAPSLEGGATQNNVLTLHRGEQILFKGRRAALAGLGWREGVEGEFESALPEASVPLLIKHELLRGGTTMLLGLRALSGEARRLRIARAGDVLFEGPLVAGMHLLELPLLAGVAANVPLDFTSSDAAGQPSALNIALQSLTVGVPALYPGVVVNLGAEVARPMLSHGWSNSEGAHVWSVAPEAELTFLAPLDERQYDLILLLRGHAGAQLSIRLDDTELASWKSNGIAEKISLSLPPECRGRIVRVRLCSDAALFAPGDPRNLRLCAIQIWLASASD